MFPLVDSMNLLNNILYFKYLSEILRSSGYLKNIHFYTKAIFDALCFLAPSGLTLGTGSVETGVWFWTIGSTTANVAVTIRLFFPETSVAL